MRNRTRHAEHLEYRRRMMQQWAALLDTWKQGESGEGCTDQNNHRLATLDKVRRTYVLGL